MERIVKWMGRQRETLRMAAQALRAWTARQWFAALAAGTVVALVIGVATVLIPNPLFARDIPTVPWNYPVWIITSALMGLLVATYVQPSSPSEAPAGTQDAPGSPETVDAGLAGERRDPSERRSARMGGAAGILAWFAVGCPVCNKIALIALGYTGALTWFAPLQPYLAGIALVLSVFAVVWRLRGQVSCPLPTAPRQVVSVS